MRRFFALLLIASLFASPSYAATKKPVAQPTATKKATATKKVTLTKKATVAKKKVVAKKRKPVYRKRVKVSVSPSPSPKWPPVNFTANGDIYAKIPSAVELKGLASANLDLTAALRNCEKSICGAVLVASEKGCSWWEVNSVVTGPDAEDATKKVNFGTLRTLALGTRPRITQAIMLITGVDLADGFTVGSITAKCWTTAKPENVPSNTYTALK